MDEPRDDIDAWLAERVTPLQPHQGAFEQVRRRARRRKLGRAALAAAGAAVVVAGGLAVPRLILGPIGGKTVVASGTPTPTQQASAHPSRPSPSGTSGPQSHSSTPVPPPPVPANFAVSSVTFVSTNDGWVLGQAGIPGQCGPPNLYICTSIAATSDGGAHWHGLPAPVAGAPNGGTGVSQIRFLDGVNGWAFGPQLYATHNRGQTWHRIPTHGMRVTDLETVNGRAYAVWARCTGTGPHFTADCTAFSLYSSPAGADSWAPVPGATGLHSSTAAPAGADLVLTSPSGYLLGPDDVVVTGPIGNPSAWHVLTGASGGTQAAPCGPGPGGLAPQSLPGMFASTGPGLVVLCPTRATGSRQNKTIYYSQDGGSSWQLAGTAPSYGIATSLAGTPNGPLVVATTKGIYLSRTAPRANGSLTWFRGQGLSAPGGYSWVGMTTALQGVAIPADTSLHAVWFTYDGGRHWQESPVR